jgi:hypothetical protein
MTSNNQNITLRDNWRNSGEYVPGYNMVRLVGGDQIVRIRVL